MVRCGTWARDELRRLGRMAKDSPAKAEWNAFYARLNRLIALFIDSDSEAGKLVRHIDTEMGSLFTFLHEEGVDPTNNFGGRRLGMPYSDGNAAKGPAVIKGKLRNDYRHPG